LLPRNLHICKTSSTVSYSIYSAGTPGERQIFHFPTTARKGQVIRKKFVTSQDPEVHMTPPARLQDYLQGLTAADKIMKVPCTKETRDGEWAAL